MVVSGMHIAWGIWRSNFFVIEDAWVPNISRDILIFTITSWYITAIFGSLVGSYIMPWQKKKVVYVNTQFFNQTIETHYDNFIFYNYYNSAFVRPSML